ncbi:MAG: 3-dehydroquinate synthase [Epulopiscium sp. Nuni2H_MBin003]|nr:MAG: 3-dehydroquinate synthase [Epulopiscium sp. Nuni2H_MBin003]
MKKLKVDLGINSYPIYIEDGLLEKVDTLIEKHLPKTKKVFIITDTNVEKYYLEIIKKNLSNFTVEYMVIEAGEKSKSIAMLEPIFTKLVAAKLTRTDAIIALGGGVVGDLAGFIASIYLRGINFVQIPTSLLAQVDSSVGGKVAVDLIEGKNLVGSFYHPKLVIIDPKVLQTLPQKFIADGLGEVTKYAFIKDAELYEYMIKFENMQELIENIADIIYICCDIKKTIVEQDEKDTAERMVLNFGHTLGHAIETVCGYENYTHGEAVAIGMYEITKISEKMGLTKAGTLDKIKKLLDKYNLDTQLPDMQRDELFKVIELDKKNLSQQLNLILLKEVGECYIHQTSIDFFKEV